MRKCWIAASLFQQWLLFQCLRCQCVMQHSRKDHNRTASSKAKKGFVMYNAMTWQCLQYKAGKPSVSGLASSKGRKITPWQAAITYCDERFGSSHPWQPFSGQCPDLMDIFWGGSCCHRGQALTCNMEMERWEILRQACTGPHEKPVQDRTTTVYYSRAAPA